MSDRAAACPHCGCPVTPSESPTEVSPSSIETASEITKSESPRLISAVEEIAFANTVVDTEQPDVPMIANNFSAIAEILKTSPQVRVKRRMMSRLMWFLAANAGVVASVSIITDGQATGAIPYLLIVSCLFPFLLLHFSRWLAKRAHGIVLIDANTDDEVARALYATVEGLAKRAGLKRVPEVGIYDAPDMNAFATGPTRRKSLVAFSTALLEEMDERSVAAVAAHEISHVANGDMITLALVQSVVNAVVYLITIPLSVIRLIALFDANIGVLAFWLISVIRFLLTLFLLFLGSLVVKSFSRRREFKADALAAKLLDRDAMIVALETLANDSERPPRKLQPYAAMKINSPRRWLDIFSTHPSTERRIRALRQQKRATS